MLLIKHVYNIKKNIRKIEIFLQYLFQSSFVEVRKFCLTIFYHWKLFTNYPRLFLKQCIEKTQYIKRQKKIQLYKSTAQEGNELIQNWIAKISINTLNQACSLAKSSSLQNSPNYSSVFLFQIVEAGIGEICPPDAFVKFHYVAFNEYDEVPFDVSKLRRKFPESKKLGSGELIPGLELGIATMRKKEKAHFIIHYDFAFGILGCGERIPPSEYSLLSGHWKIFMYQVKRWHLRGERPRQCPPPHHN